MQMNLEKQNTPIQKWMKEEISMRYDRTKRIFSRR
jgi:hypothetical protein